MCHIWLSNKTDLCNECIDIDISGDDNQTNGECLAIREREREVEVRNHEAGKSSFAMDISKLGDNSLSDICDLLPTSMFEAVTSALCTKDTKLSKLHTCVRTYKYTLTSADSTKSTSSWTCVFQVGFERSYAKVQQLPRSEERKVNVEVYACPWSSANIRITCFA